MPYWIVENGEKIGPLKAIDVLRRAQPTMQVSDGENWFSIDEPSMAGASASPDTDHGEPMPAGGRLTIR
jgi:hypothetical protein